MLHRVAEEPEAKVSLLLLLDRHQRFDNDGKGILAFVHENEWKLLRHEGSEKRAMYYQLRSHLDDVVVAEDAFGVITSRSKKGWWRCAH